MNSNDEQAIFSETEAFSEAWNKGDAKTAASFYTNDGERVGAFGDVQRRSVRYHCTSPARCLRFWLFASGVTGGNISPDHCQKAASKTQLDLAFECLIYFIQQYPPRL